MKKIFWNDGHSKTDPGAVGYVVERKVAVKVGDYAIAYLKANYKVSIKRSTGDIGDMNYICNEANKWGADLFVSVHFNAGKGDGYEALVYSKDNYQLGRVFEKHVLGVGQNSRGVKYRPDLGVLRLTDMKAILNEIAFVDNKKDIKDWDEPHELKKMGIALAEATAEYMKLPKKKKTNASTNASNASTNASTPKKTVEQIAKEVIQGKWGNGEGRKNKLIKAGYDPYAVQKKVNQLLK